MEVLVYDNDDGVILEFDSEDGMAHTFYLDEETSHNLVSMIQNKLDGHFKK